MASGKPSLCLSLPVCELSLVLCLNEEADLGLLPPSDPASSSPAVRARGSRGNSGKRPPKRDGRAWARSRGGLGWGPSGPHLVQYFPGPAVPSSERPSPILVMHTGTCQGLASQGLEGAPAGDFKSPNAFQKGTKTFCLTKASTGEQPSPFLFKSLYFPAGWPGHSLFFLL